MSTSKWAAGSFLIGIPPGSTELREGWTYKGIGLHEGGPGRWHVTHLNSGHAVAYITGTFGEVLPIATLVADLTDWNFRGLDGWTKSDPSLPKKMWLLSEANDRLDMAVRAKNRSQRVASSIASARTA